MFYKFNQITQSLTSATQNLSMAKPANVNATSTVLAATPEVHYEYQLPVSEAADAAKQRAKGYPVPNNPKYRRLMDLQTKFTAADGKLVWEKLPKDKPLYYLTVAMVSAGFMLTLYTIKKLATPPKNE